MKYLDKYCQLQDEVWKEFQNAVRKGVVFDIITEVYYPIGENVIGLDKNTEGQCWFYAKAIVADSEYNLLVGENLIVGANKVKYIDIDDNEHFVEPDITDLAWLCEVLDNRTNDRSHIN